MRRLVILVAFVAVLAGLWIIRQVDWDSYGPATPPLAVDVVDESAITIKQFHFGGSQLLIHRLPSIGRSMSMSRSRQPVHREHFAFVCRATQSSRNKSCPGNKRAYLPLRFGSTLSETHR